MAADDEAPLYGSFLRRVQALQVDAIVLMALLSVAIVLAMELRSEWDRRLVGAVAVALVLLYEPVLVSAWGGTLGHRQRNLHVVDERTGGRLGFGKAVLRSVVKAVLGWFSFLSMIFTRRSQALHDMATRSTIRIRDRQRARPGDYVRETDPAAVLAGRSIVRIVVVAMGWSLLVFALLTALFVGLEVAGVLGPACIQYDRCSAGERLVANAFGLSVILTVVAIVILAWRGLLPGCRVR